MIISETIIFGIIAVIIVVGGGSIVLSIFDSYTGENPEKRQKLNQKETHERHTETSDNLKYTESQEFYSTILELNIFDKKILSLIKPTLKKELNFDVYAYPEKTGKHSLDYLFDCEFNRTPSLNPLIEDEVIINKYNEKIYKVSGFEKLYASIFDIDLKIKLLLPNKNPNEDVTFNNRIDVWNEFYDRLNELYSTQQSEVQNAYKTHN